MNKIKSFLDRKIVTKDVGEETYITWREALSYAMGRGAQGMSTSMTASKYVNFFITDVLHIKARHASNIRLYCGIFDAINDPIMGVIVDKTRTKYGKMRPYIKFAPYFVSLFMLLFFIGNDSLSYGAKIALTVFAFVGLDVTYTAFDVPMGALAFSMTPNGTERTKLYGVASIGRMILGLFLPGWWPLPPGCRTLTRIWTRRIWQPLSFPRSLLFSLPVLPLRTLQSGWSTTRRRPA